MPLGDVPEARDLFLRLKFLSTEAEVSSFSRSRGVVPVAVRDVPAAAVEELFLLQGQLFLH